MFRGRFEHQIDAKGRLSVPSKFREALAAADSERLIITNFDQCLWGYSMGEWQDLERKVASASQFREEIKALQRAFISVACECPIDKSGRILIPPSLRNYAALEKDVVIVGATKRIEIWSLERWQPVFEEAQQKLDGLGAKLSELGF